MSALHYRCGRCKQLRPAEKFTPAHRANGYYCRDCDAVYQRERAIAARADKPAAYCQECGEALPADRASQRRYCDTACRDAAHLRRRYGERKPDPFPQLRDGAWLRTRYVDERMTQREIAALLGCAKNTVAQAMRAVGIEPRREHVGVCGCCGRGFTAKTAKPATYCSIACQIRARALRERYHLSVEDFQQMIRAQGYRCAICRTAECPSGNALAIDHCHDTGKVRGLLCSPCNTGLGQFRDRTDLLRAAIDYLDGTA